MTTSFSKLATVTASTKRIPAIASGKIGSRAVNVVSLKCTPIDPLGTGSQPSFDNVDVLDAHSQLYVTYCESTTDIQQGDEFIVGTVSYTVRTVEDWAFDGANYLRVILSKYRK